MPPSSTLRFQPPPLPPPSLSFSELTRHILPLLSSRISPLPYLPIHPPSHHIYLALLTLLPPSTVSPHLDPNLSTFLSALSLTPARIPSHIRPSSAKTRPVAIFAALAAYHATLVRLLALDDPLTEAASDLTDSVSARDVPGARPKLWAADLRWRIASAAVKREMKALPLGRRPHLLGFVPRYLEDAGRRKGWTRNVLATVLEEAILGRGTVGRGLRCIVWYILGRACENETLVAHSAFWAHRFGVTWRRLAACSDTDGLAREGRRWRRRRRRGGSVSSVSSVTVSPRRDAWRGERRIRSVMMVRSDSWGRGEMGTVGWRTGSESDEEEEESTDSSDEVRLPSTNVDEAQFRDLDDDNPQVPDVQGLNAIHAPEELDVVDHTFAAAEQHNEEATFSRMDTSVSTRDYMRMFDEDIIAEQDAFGANSVEGVFSEEEVAVLLLAHDVADALRRNSRRAVNNPGATPEPLVQPATAAMIHQVMEPDAIMDIVSVISTYQFFQRWTVCFPYRPGTLEEPVFKFLQSPMAHDLCVSSVGQRSSSKSSAILRVRRGRSIRLPRHALVD